MKKIIDVVFIVGLIIAVWESLFLIGGNGKGRSCAHSPL